MNNPKERHFSFNAEIPIVSSYRRSEHLKELKTAALYFKDLGLSTYPHHLHDPIIIDNEFVFFGGDQMLFTNKRDLEINFLKVKVINRAKLVYVVATNGYLGRSASIELAFGLLMSAPIALSQPITEFGEGVPQEIKNIVENNKTLLPIIPIKKIKELEWDRGQSSLPRKEKPPLVILDQEDRKAILLSIRSLVRQLEQ